MTEPHELALAALRRAASEVDLLAAGATRLSEETAWRSRAADRYRTAVGDWIDDIRRLAASVRVLGEDIRAEAARRTASG